MSKKIWNWVIGKQEPETETKVAKTDNAVDAQKELLDAITVFFKQHFFGIKTFTDTVVLWVDNSNPVYQSYVRNKELKSNLKTELDNKQLYAISNAKFEFKTENPPQDMRLPSIAEGVYIQLIAKEKEDGIQDKAIISIFNGKGSLMEPEYRLDGTIQTEYNIGNGRGDGKNNDIIINDDDTANKEINSFVSRQHAKIVFVPEKGFCLKTRNEENRTIVYRKNQRVKNLEVLIDKFLLKDNDVIELGDKDNPLLLKFEIEKNINQSGHKRTDIATSSQSSANGFVENDLGI